MDSLGSTQEQAKNKLILLYVIEGLNISVSNLQMTKLILENNFMNYFLLQQFLNELCQSAHLSSEVQNGKTFYRITVSGKNTLSYFSGLIPLGIKARIDNTITGIRKNIKNETLITADFVPESENEYIVNCSVGEDNFPLAELHITVGTKNDARAVCDNWKKYSQAIYAELIESLTKNRD